MSRDRPKTVVFVDPTHVQVGGVGTFEARIAAELPRRGWRAVFALTRGRRFHSPERFLANLPPLEWVPIDGRSGAADDRRIEIRRLLRRLAPDVVLPGAVQDAWAALEESKADLHAPRLVYGMHGVALTSAAFVKAHAPVVDSAFAVGPLPLRILTDYCGIDAARASLIASGVEPCQKASSPRPAEPIRLLYVGRFDPDKRVLDALALAKELSRRGVAFELTLVGSGVHQAELEGAARVSNGTIRLLPPTPLPRLYEDVYPSADAVLIFSPIEGLANALLEGMAHGLVAITSNFRGRESLGLYRDGETALVFEVGDTAGTADCVASLLRTPALKSRIGGAGRRLVERERGVGQMADQFVRVLDLACEGPPRVGPVPASPAGGRSRLRSVLGPRVAGAVRRLLGLHFEHADASEWPLIDNVEPPQRQKEEAILRRALDRFEGKATSERPHD